MDESEITGHFAENTLDPAFHPRYGALAALKISKHQKESDSDESDEESQFGTLEA
jgi:hypothetical protein